MSKKESKPASKPPVETAKVVKPNNDIQIHFGNAELIKIRLLEAIAKNTAQIAKAMMDVKEAK